MKDQLSKSLLKEMIYVGFSWNAKVFLTTSIPQKFNYVLIRVENYIVKTLQFIAYNSV